MGGWEGSQGLQSDFAHQTVDHAIQYVDGVVHTNMMENFWALLKRALSGAYVSVEPFHLFRYLGTSRRIGTTNVGGRTVIGSSGRSAGYSENA